MPSHLVPVRFSVSFTTLACHDEMQRGVVQRGRHRRWAWGQARSGSGWASYEKGSPWRRKLVRSCPPSCCGCRRLHHASYGASLFSCAHPTLPRCLHVSPSCIARSRHQGSTYIQLEGCTRKWEEEQHSSAQSHKQQKSMWHSRESAPSFEFNGSNGCHFIT